jgi:hypothetical protein
MPGLELLVRASAWLSLLAWAGSEWTAAAARARGGGWGIARGLSTAGLVAMAGHSALAFHLRYAWSQEAALRDAARQVQAVTGLDFGEGLFVNYAFLLVWAAEAAWWWCAAQSYRTRPAALDWTVRGFFLFMFVNGAVVFAHGPVRVAGLLAALVVAAAWYRRAGG